jgi:hypothetical protein
MCGVGIAPKGIGKRFPGMLLSGAAVCALALSLASVAGAAPTNADNTTPPATQPSAGGGGGAGNEGDAVPAIGGLYGGGGGGGGGVSDPEATAAVNGGGGGGGGGLSDGTPASFDEAAAIANVPLPAAIWAGLTAAGGIGLYLKTRKRVAR